MQRGQGRHKQSPAGEEEELIVTAPVGTSTPVQGTARADVHAVERGTRVLRSQRGMQMQQTQNGEEEELTEEEEEEQFQDCTSSEEDAASDESSRRDPPRRKKGAQIAALLAQLTAASIETMRRQDRMQGEEDQKREGHHRKRTQMAQVTFDGTTEFQDFLPSFQAAARLQEWTADEKAAQLHTRLQGEALSVAATLHDPSFEELTEALTAQYGPRTAASCRLQLKAREQKKSETLREFAHQMTKLTKGAYPKATSEVLDELAVSSFIEGVTDAHVRTQLRATDPADMAEALQRATLLQDGRDAEKQRARLVTSSQEAQPAPTQPPAVAAQGVLPQPEAEMQTLLGAVKELVREVREVREERGKAPTGGQGGKWKKSSQPQKLALCFFCEQPGHFVRECPYKTGTTKQALPGTQQPGNANGRL